MHIKGLSHSQRSLVQAPEATPKKDQAAAEKPKKAAVKAGVKKSEVAKNTAAKSKIKAKATTKT